MWSRINRLSPRFFSIAALVLVSISVATAATPWRFKQTFLYKKWDYARIESENVTIQGGTVDFVISGDAAGLCPRGNEHVRITWRFDKDIAEFKPGDNFGAKIEARMTSASGSCNGALSYRTFAYVSAGVAAITWDDVVGARMDAERFQNVRGDRATPDRNGPNTAESVIRVTENEPYADRPIAGFVVYIGGVPNGHIAYLYRYQPAGGNACGFTLGSGIFNKWQSLGGERGFLRCPTMSEAEAGKSPRGTTGRYAKFLAPPDGGVIHWIRNGANAGQSFETHGCIYKLFSSLGGSVSWLGFPVSDEFSVQGGRRSNFEGGYIFWNASTAQCQAYRY